MSAERRIALNEGDEIVDEITGSPHVDVVDVAHRQSDDIELRPAERRLESTQGVSREHEVEKPHRVSRPFRGLRDHAGAGRKDRHWIGISICADDKNVHGAENRIAPLFMLHYSLHTRFLTISTAFVPPKEKEFDMTVLRSAPVLAFPGT